MSKKSIRENFRNSVFSRDTHKCVFCDVTTDLDAHHITDRHLIFNGGYVKENGITLCRLHHDLVEDWNRYGEVTDEKYHPDNLYKLIKSNRPIAFRESARLAIQEYARIIDEEHPLYNFDLPICSKNINGMYILIDECIVEYFQNESITRSAINVNPK